MLTNKKAIIFDLDGTLVDSMGVWKEIDIEYLAEYGQTLPDDLQKCIEGMCFRDTAIYMKNRFSIPDDVDTIMARWNQMAEYKYTHQVTLKPGVIELIENAKEHGLKLGIATSNSRHLMDALAKAKDIEKYFDYILTGCETLKSKPDPEVYITAAEKLGVDPKDCLVFEDIVVGITAGKRAGMTVCGVEDHYSSYQRKEKMELSDYYIETYYDVKLL